MYQLIIQIHSLYIMIQMVFNIDGSNLVSCSNGISTNNYQVSNSLSNPGTESTLWYINK